MNIRVENWMGHEIRFVEFEVDDWWAVAKDVSDALGFSDSRQMTRTLDEDEISSFNWKKKQTAFKADSFSDYKYKPLVPIISEFGIYEAVFNSERQEAKDFKRWVKQMLRELRKASGLEGFQIFRTLDKEHQKEAMERLKEGLRESNKPDFIKANTIANKAVSTMFGYPKMVKKDHMTPEMLVRRQEVLDDTVNLMSTAAKFGLDIKISDTIYSKHADNSRRALPRKRQRKAAEEAN